ncbi:MAG: hypothetical protein SCALA702_02180 [Melioribacteraceae bacterium]|nr:MAG: hypothetical protein SCALA702_02180 [Melioribacteraceae bacterium]
MSKIKIITTTSNIEGWNIEKYFGIVTHQIVVGANLFRDVFSSFRDVFGGMVKSYQNELKGMEDHALHQLKKKATKMGANAIIALKVDFDEISGGGKSMFMLSLVGTAVKASAPDEKIIAQNEMLTSEYLEYLVSREQLLEELVTKEFHVENTDEFEEILKFNIKIGSSIIEFINEKTQNSDTDTELLTAYMTSLSNEELSMLMTKENIQELGLSKFHKLVAILKQIGWANYDVFLNLIIQSNVKILSRCLFLMQLQPAKSTKEQIPMLEKLISSIPSAYEVFPVIETKVGVFGKEKEKWKCIKCNNLNNREQVVCTNPDCNSNIYGIPGDEINPEQLVKLLKRRLKIIQEYYDAT